MTNERQWADAVKGSFETALGLLDFAVTSHAHVHIESPRYAPGGAPLEAPVPVLIHRVPYHLSIHIKRKQDGTWGVENLQDVYLSRPNSAKAFDYSLAAKQKARDVVSAAWTKYAAEHPEIFKPAELRHLNNDILRLDEQIAEKEKELADLKVKRDALMEKESALNGARK